MAAMILIVAFLAEAVIAAARLARPAQSARIRSTLRYDRRCCFKHKESFGCIWLLQA